MILKDEIIIRTESVGKKLLLAKCDSDRIALVTFQSVWSSGVIKCVYGEEDQVSLLFTSYTCRLKLQCVVFLELVLFQYLHKIIL